jgi:hypothetical protein
MGKSAFDMSDCSKSMVLDKRRQGHRVTGPLIVVEGQRVDPTGGVQVMLL